MNASQASTSTSRRLVRTVAGLACAALLASCTGTTEVAGTATSTAIPTATSVVEQSEPTPVATATSIPEQPESTPVSPAPTPSPTVVPPTEPTPTEQVLRTVLVVIKRVPQGTLAREIMRTPTVFLGAESIPEELVDPLAITTLFDLEVLDEFAVIADLVPGEQLLRSHFFDTGFGSSDPTPRIVVAIPPGHEAEVVVLPPSRAAAGLIRAGEVVRVVETSDGVDGRPSSSTLFEGVEVLGTEAVLGSDAITLRDADYAITIAVTPDEASALAEARAQSAILTLAAQSPIANAHSVGIEMTHAQALDGEVRAGDIVSVTALADDAIQGADPAVAVSDVEVLYVTSTALRPPSTFSILVSVTAEELLVLTTAIAKGQVALTQ